jgi:hypothetical protein
MIKSRRMRWAGHVAEWGRRRTHIGYWWEKSRRDNIKIDLRETGWDGRNWIDMAQDRDQWRALLSTVIHLRVP